MSRTAWMWRGLGPLTLGGLLLTGVGLRTAEPPPLPRQLTDLGRQALEQGESAQARTFFRKALQLDPRNAEARRALARLPLALQDPAPQPAAPADPAPPPAEAAPPAADPIPAAPAPAPDAAVVDEPAASPAARPQATPDEAARVSD